MAGVLTAGPAATPALQEPHHELHKEIALFEPMLTVTLEAAAVSAEQKGARSGDGDWGGTGIYSMEWGRDTATDRRAGIDRRVEVERRPDFTSTLVVVVIWEDLGEIHAWVDGRGLGTELG